MRKLRAATTKDVALMKGEPGLKGSPATVLQVATLRQVEGRNKKKNGQGNITAKGGYDPPS